MTTGGEPSVHAYGEDPAQFLELTLPAGAAPAPVVVVLHGGFWRARYGVELARPLAADLASRGWAAVAVEYRRVGAGGGWPQTLQDVAAALDVLPDLPQAGRLDLRTLAVVGHSAGGHLAGWAAGRGRLPEGAPGAGPRVAVTAAVLQAGVLDLEAAVEEHLGNGATVDFMGGRPDELAERYLTTDPVRLLPTGVPVLCVHGASDTTVPLEQSERFVAAATDAGDAAELLVVPGDHSVVLDLTTPGWQDTVEWLAAHRTRTTLEP